MWGLVTRGLTTVGACNQGVLQLWGLVTRGPYNCGGL